MSVKLMVKWVKLGFFGLKSDFFGHLKKISRINQSLAKTHVNSKFRKSPQRISN